MSLGLSAHSRANSCVALGRSLLVGLELFLASDALACGGLAVVGDGGSQDAPTNSDVDVGAGEDAPTDHGPGTPDASEASTTSDTGAADVYASEASPTASCDPDDCASYDYCKTLLNTVPDAGLSSCVRLPTMCEMHPTCSCILDATPSTSCFMASCRVTDGGQIVVTCAPPPP
jgi:hypothetical protein